ncbi:MAG: DNA mismatch repair endonuclease MutL [Clostridia bacterium]
MNKILVLEKNTRDQIAAGEVAERPALIIKELIENAIDASATDIRVLLKESGISEIRVIDNGCGIDKEDIPNAFLRHATSKIQKIEDLDSLMTMGFRGEALASIAAVSKIRIRTKTSEASSAFECSLEGGEISEITPSPGNEGTEIVVDDLFFNTPARKKFLATPVREIREISDMVGRIIIAHPHIRFELLNNGKRIFMAPGNSDMNAAIAAVYGTEPLKFLLPLSDHSSFSGYIAHPNYSKPNRNYFHFYINHRYIQSTELNKALENAYKTLLPERRFPLAFINVILPPDQYDINVHPNKLDVKFNRDLHIEDQLFDLIKTTLETAERSYTTEIHEEKPAKEFTEETPPPLPKIHQDLRPVGLPGAVERKKKILAMGDDFEAIRAELIGTNRGIKTGISPKPKMEKKTKSKEIASMDEVQKLFARDSYDLSDFFHPENKEKQTEQDTVPVSVTETISEEPAFAELISAEEKTIDFQEGFYSSLDILGQVGGSFIAACSSDALYLIDQHAAHERLMFNRIKKDLREKNTLSQPLLVPQEISLNYNQFNWMVEHILILREMGFVLEEFGENSFILREVPVWAENADATVFLKEFADGWLHSEKELTIEAVLERKIMSKACKSAVKANQYLSKSDILYIFKELDKAEDGFTCPHGRPICVKFTMNEIRRKFLRT